MEGREDACVIDVRRFLVGRRISSLVALKPFRPAFQNIFMLPVRLNTSDNANAALLRRLEVVAEQIAVTQELALVMIGNPSGVEGHEAAAGENEAVQFQAGPIVYPCVDVQHLWVVLV